MKNDKKSYSVRIFDDHYTLISDESERHIEESASMVDSLMKEIAEKSTVTDPKKVAVLTALRIASDLAHMRAREGESGRKQDEIIEALDRTLSSYSDTLLS